MGFADEPEVRDITRKMGIRLDKAEMIAIFLETFLYGICFTLFSITCIVLYRQAEAGHRQYRKLLPAGMIMFLLASGHVVISFVRVLEAFVDDVPGGATAYYSNISHPLHIAKTVCYVTQTLLGDCVMLWRCFVVYNRSWYIAIPSIIIMIANTCAGYIVTWLFAKARSDINIFEVSAATGITVFFILTMVVNSACTVAIAYRIYSTRRKLPVTRHLLPVFIVIIESGALYAASVLSLLIAYLAKSNGQYVAVDAVTPLVGIVFSLIVLQIHFHLGSETPYRSSEVDAVDKRPTSAHPHNITPLSFPVQLVSRSEIGCHEKDQGPDEENLLRNNL